jgi:type I site-specific restriction-modification system R (restriction) subunit
LTGPVGGGTPAVTRLFILQVGLIIALELSQAFAISLPSEKAIEIREAEQRGENLELTEAKLVFYDALGVNDNAVVIPGDEVLKKITQDLVKTIRENVTIDWSSRESVRVSDQKP